MKISDIKSVAKRVIQIEADAVSLIGSRIDEHFESAVQAILECTGRLIVSGMGKSGLISQKIASEIFNILNSSLILALGFCMIYVGAVSAVLLKWVVDF